MKVSVLFEITGPGQKGRVLETTKLMGGLVQEFPALRPLAVVLKQLLVERGLNDPYSGGLSSFALVLMIAFVLQRRRARNGIDIAEDLGGALEEFLRFFGEEFDPATQGISMQRGCFTLPCALPSAPAEADGGGISAPARDPLTIEDPTNSTNNVGRPCFGVALLRKTLADALSSLGDSGTAGSGAAATTLGRLFKTTHHTQVVDLVRRTWCPADPQLVLRAEAELVAESPACEALRAELEALRAERDAWELRATRAETQVVQLTARVSEQEKRLGKSGVAGQDAENSHEKSIEKGWAALAERFAETLTMQHP